MSDSGSLEALVERLLAGVQELESVVVQQRRVIAQQADRIVELERRLGRDSSTSSRPPSSDAPWDKQPAKKRSSRSRSGRKPGKQPGSASTSRSVVDDPDETFEVAADHCARCEKSLDDAEQTARVRRQVVDVPEDEVSLACTWRDVHLEAGVAAVAVDHLVVKLVPACAEVAAPTSSV